MQRSPTLYKINRHTASGDAIVVETTARPSAEKPHVLFCGGFHSSMQGVKAEFLRSLCQQNGWGFTRFDYLGHGVSDGKVEHCSLHDWLNDTLAVVDELENEIVVIGSSMGAWLATHACLQRPEKISALLTIAAAPDFTEVLLWPALSETQQAAIANEESVVIPTAYEGDDWRIRRCLFESGRDLALLANNKPLRLSVPVRMLHGTGDIDVPWTLSQRLLEKFSHSKDATLTLIQGADHRLSDDRCLRELKRPLEQLFERLRA